MKKINLGDLSNLKRIEDSNQIGKDLHPETIQALRAIDDNIARGFARAGEIFLD